MPVSLTDRLLGGFAGLMAALAVAAGAYAAHRLPGETGARAAELLRTAASYQLWHALAILVALRFGPAARASALLFAGGIVLFSWSIAWLAFGGPRPVGYVTPLGGILLILGWLLLGWALLTGRGSAGRRGNL
jgi:uncharacterized membrane protein YgdD (TMEM256/DUF423 family)